MMTKLHKFPFLNAEAHCHINGRILAVLEFTHEEVTAKPDGHSDGVMDVLHQSLVNDSPFAFITSPVERLIDDIGDADEFRPCAILAPIGISTIVCDMDTVESRQIDLWESFSEGGWKELKDLMPLFLERCRQQCERNKCSWEHPKFHVYRIGTMWRPEVTTDWETGYADLDAWMLVGFFDLVTNTLEV